MATLTIEFHNLALLTVSPTSTEVLLPSRRHHSKLCHPGWDKPVPLANAAVVKILRDGDEVNGTSGAGAATSTFADLNKIGGGKLSLKTIVDQDKCLNARVVLGGGTYSALPPNLRDHDSKLAGASWPFYQKRLDSLDDDTHEAGVEHSQPLTNAFTYTLDGASKWAVKVGEQLHELTVVDGAATLVVWTDEENPDYRSPFQPTCCQEQLAQGTTDELPMWNGCVQDFGYFYELFDQTGTMQPIPFKPDGYTPSGVCIWEPICPVGFFLFVVVPAVLGS